MKYKITMQSGKEYEFETDKDESYMISLINMTTELFITKNISIEAAYIKDFEVLDEH